jgi:ubiquinone/menaquinone biosynthesis C-methylase UbiE
LLRVPSATDVDAYWTRHTVRADEFKKPKDSEAYLEWRFEQYPLFREFSGLWGEHDGETIVDVGCGPGNDLTGFALNTGADRIIGLDVSPTALELARRRLDLHGIDNVELIQTSNADPTIPLDDASADYLQCLGVLMCTTSPQDMLAEFRRVLKPGGRAAIMVYSRPSVWYHLYTAYEKLIVEDAFPGLTIDEAFQRNTDGPECPISEAWEPANVQAMCEAAGFSTFFTGGYVAKHELVVLHRSWNRAIVDERLSEESREFLRELRMDHQGLPMRGPWHAGIGAVFHLRPA